MKSLWRVLGAGLTLFVAAFFGGMVTAAAPAPWSPLTARANTTYYVSPMGNNENSGLSPTAAWKTIQKLNEVIFQQVFRVRFGRMSDLFMACIASGCAR